MRFLKTCCHHLATSYFRRSMSTTSISASSSTSSSFISSSTQFAELIVLSNGYLSTPKSCLMRVNSSTTYLINCGEGTQRILMNAGLPKSISSIGNILVTKFDWSCIGGLHSFGKMSDEVTSQRKQLPKHGHEVTWLHTPVMGHATCDFLSHKFRSLFFDEAFKMKCVDYAKNNNEFRDDAGVVVKCVPMLDKPRIVKAVLRPRFDDDGQARMLAGEEDDKNQFLCFSYIFELQKPEPKFDADYFRKQVKCFFLTPGSTFSAALIFKAHFWTFRRVSNFKLRRVH